MNVAGVAHPQKAIATPFHPAWPFLSLICLQPLCAQQVFHQQMDTMLNATK